jgi:hypothetical protein
VPTQSAFIKGRYILESVVVAHEIVHSVNKSGEQGVILKLDYEKAYDRVSWSFLFEMLESRNFSPVLINWIKQTVVGGSLSIMLNESLFQNWQGAQARRPPCRPSFSTW